jgi:hypothetical protein
MPIRIEDIRGTEEHGWRARLAGNGMVNNALYRQYTSGEAWDQLLAESQVLLFPKSIGQGVLNNYVLFDIWDTGGAALTKQLSTFPGTISKGMRAAFASVAGQEAGANKGWFTDSKTTEHIDAELESIAQEETDKAVKDAANYGVAGAALGYFAGGAAGAIAGGLAGVAFQNNLSNFASALQSANGANVSDALQGKGLNSFSSTRLGFANKTERVGLSIALPMPKTLVTNYGIEYDETDFTGAVTALSALKAMETIQAGGRATEEMKEVVRKIGTLPSDITDSLGKVIGVNELNVTKFTEASNRQAPNTFKEQTFKAVKRRTFEFEWEFVPKSEEDAILIYAIIYAFKKYSHPKMSGGGLYLDYPGQFKIGFFTGTRANDYLYKMGLCACKEVNVEYGSSEGLDFFRQFEINDPPFNDIPPGAPNNPTTGANADSRNSRRVQFSPANSLKLKVSFDELELLTRERIQQGF